MSTVSHPQAFVYQYNKCATQNMQYYNSLARLSTVKSQFLSPSV